jgi:hypothetical protein
VYYLCHKKAKYFHVGVDPKVVNVVHLAQMKATPLKRAARSAEQNFWTVRPPEDVRRLMARAIRDMGRDKGFWIWECVRLGLSQYAGKKDSPPALLPLKAKISQS